MKNLNTYIQENTCINEKLIIVHRSYSCAPQMKEELREIIVERLKKDPDADLNDIDVSNIKYMNKLFVGLDPHNIDISRWDVSNVENMNSMFYECINFNSDLSKWDVSNVEDMSSMFDNCENFNSDISRWDVSNVRYMSYMFWKCKKFNMDLNSWNVSKHTVTFNTFAGCDNMEELPKWFVK